MQQPIHTLTRPTARWTNERIVGVGFVALLHVIAVWAILAGLVQKYVRPADPPPITWIEPEKHEQPPPTQPKMPTVDPTDTSRQVLVPPPIFVIDDGEPRGGGTVVENPQSLQPAMPDTFVSGISGTHTIPAYPALARRLGEQGRVRLSLAISATGEVTAATVVQSSGFADLDQTAVNWVIGHWKYKPATHGGVAVPSQSLAIVVFNLQNAG
jgi:protein TonB